MFMNITPSTTNGANNFDLKFTSPFYQSGDSTTFILSSTPFKIAGVDHYFGDVPITGTTDRKVIVYKIVSGNNVTVINDAGLIDVVKGTVTLNNFTPDDTSSIRITVTPNSLDLAPKRDQLISIDSLRVNITPEVDTIAVSGASGTINYTTPSRLR